MVSVCIATYNGEKYLRQQIESILPQLSIEDEIVISDDCSTDRTVEILKVFNDERIKIFVNESNLGVVENFENAIKQSIGEYVFLSDQDDVWEPNKVETIKQLLQTYDFVSHNAEIINDEGERQGVDYFSVRKTKYGYLNNLWKMGYLGCCMAFNRKCLTDILPFPKGILWHDMWIAAILHLKYKGTISELCLINYRRHDSNLSTSSEKSEYSLFFKIKYRSVMLFHSLGRYWKNFYGRGEYTL